MNGSTRTHSRARPLLLFAAGLLGAFALTTPVRGAAILYAAPNVTVEFGLNYSDLEDPATPLAGCAVLEFRDADYVGGSFADWTLISGPADGSASEIWLRGPGAAVETTTTVDSTIVAIHLHGDTNDGPAQIRVDGIVVAEIDMYSSPSVNVLVMVTDLMETTHDIVVEDIDTFGGDVAILGATALEELSLPGGELLYDVDFGSPPHTVGQAPVTGGGDAPRDRPTSIVFGDPRVVAELGDLDDQPCEFGNGTTGYDQLDFSVEGYGGLDVSYDRYHLELDVLVEVLDGTWPNDDFTILLDLPQSHSVRFMVGGDVRVFAPFGSSGVIGSYELGVPMHVEVDVDLDADEWTVYLDGEEAFTGDTSPEATELRSVRLNLSGEVATNAAAVDEFKLSGGDEPPPPPPPGPEFRRGDCNIDGPFEIGDPIFLLGALFVPFAPPSPCEDSCDVNDDGSLDIADVIGMLAALFVPGSPPPEEPYPECGVDPTDDDPLGCDFYPTCP